MDKHELFKSAFKTAQYPLRQSLFWTNDSKPDSTWSWLSRNFGQAHTEKMYAKLAEYKCNTIIFIIYCQHDCAYLVNPFVGNASPTQALAGAAADMPELERWKTLLQVGQSPEINLIPCLFFGDHLDAVQNRAFLNYFVPAAVQFLYPYARGFLAGCELNRGLSVDDMAYLVALMKGAMALMPDQKPVGVHMASTNFPQKFPGNADFYGMEFPWSPTEAEGHSVDEGVREAKRVVACSSVPVCCIEESWTPETARSRALSRELVKTAGVWMLPGPT